MNNCAIFLSLFVLQLDHQHVDLFFAVPVEGLGLHELLLCLAEAGGSAAQLFGQAGDLPGLVLYCALDDVDELGDLSRVGHALLELPLIAQQLLLQDRHIVGQSTFTNRISYK